MEVVFQIESDGSFTVVIEDIINNLHNSGPLSGIKVESNIIDSAKDYLRKQIIKSDFDIDKVSEQISSNGWDKDRIKHFISLLKEKKTEVFQSIIIHHNRSYADTLVDFDWLLKLVLGSSESKGLRYPSLQVILDCVDTSGEKKQKLYELNKDTLCKLIKHLEDYQDEC